MTKELSLARLRNRNPNLTHPPFTSRGEKLSTGILSAHVGSCRDQRRQDPTFPITSIIAPYISPMSQSSHKAAIDWCSMRGIFRLWLDAAEGVWPPAPYDRSRNNATHKKTRTRICQKIFLHAGACQCMQMHALACIHRWRPKNTCEVLPSALRVRHVE